MMLLNLNLNLSRLNRHFLRAPSARAPHALRCQRLRRHCGPEQSGETGGAPSEGAGLPGLAGALRQRRFRP